MNSSSGGACPLSPRIRKAGLGIRPGLRFQSGQDGCSGARGQPANKTEEEITISVRRTLASIAMANVRTKTEKLNPLGPEPFRPLGRRLAKRIPITKRAYPERCNGTTCHTNHEKVLDVWQGGSRSPSALFQSGNRGGPPTSPRTRTCPLPTPTPCLSLRCGLLLPVAGHLFGFLPCEIILVQRRGHGLRLIHDYAQRGNFLDCGEYSAC